MLGVRISQLILLGLIGSTTALFAATSGHPMQETMFAGVTLLLIAAIYIAERLYPMSHDWNKNTGDTIGDLGSFIIVFVTFDGALKWLIPFAILAVLPNLPGALNLPLWQEIALVFIIIEFTAWASHWAHHRFPKLWALHAMHHSPTRLYSLNNFRFHPLNHLINHLAMMLPVFLLGLSTTAILGYVAITLPILLLQHSNLPFQFGILNTIINTNAVHRWHHSTNPQEGTKNLGRALVLFDQIFGTFHLPTEHSPEKIGLFTASKSYPPASHFLRQLAYPFTKKCCP